MCKPNKTLRPTAQPLHNFVSAEIRRWANQDMTPIPLTELVSRLSHGIHHATSIERYRNIRNTGSILPGNEIIHKTFNQSRLSNCHELGAIAFFDFENADKSKLYSADAMMKWPQVLFSCRHSDFIFSTIVIGYDRSKLPKQPLYHPEIKKRLGLGGIIPYGIECCYPGSLDLMLAQQILIICQWNQTVLDIAELNNPIIQDDRLDAIGTAHNEMADTYMRVSRK